MKPMVMTGIYVLILWPGYSLADQLPEQHLADLESATIASRQQIRFGSFEISLSERGIPGTKVFRVWFDQDHDRMRVDSSNDGREWSKLSVEGENFFWYRDGGDVAAEMGLKSHNPTITYFDPRCCGLFPLPFETLHVVKLDYFKSSDYSELSIERQGDITIARYQRTDSSVETHFSSQLSGAVVFVQYTSKWRGKQVVDKVESEYTEGDLLPSAISYERHIDSNLAISQKVTIRDLNARDQPIPATVFSFAGMDVPKDTYVLETPAPKGHVGGVWDGEKMDYSGKRLNGRVSRYSQYWALAILGCAVAVISCFLLLKSQKAKASTN